jgi:hypothetical protein
VRATGLIINYIDARAERSRLMTDASRLMCAMVGWNCASVACRCHGLITNAELTYNSPRNSRTAVGLAITDVRLWRTLPANRHRWRGLAFLMRRISYCAWPVERGRRSNVRIGHVADYRCGELRPNAKRPILFNFCTYLSYGPLAGTVDVHLIEADFGRGGDGAHLLA